MYYCGSNPTALFSQSQIADTMIRLMATKPYASISVSELCRAAGISRQTFYSLFNSMENVILFALEARLCSTPLDGIAEDFSLESMSLRCSRYISGNRDFFKLLVENDVGYLVYNSLYDSFSHCRCHTASCRGDQPYIAHFLAGGITGVVQEYCATEPPTSDEELYATLCRLFHGQFFG